MRLVKLTLVTSGRPVWINPAQVCNVSVDDRGVTCILMTSGPYHAQVREAPEEVVRALTEEAR